MLAPPQEKYCCSSLPARVASTSRPTRTGQQLVLPQKCSVLFPGSNGIQVKDITTVPIILFDSIYTVRFIRDSVKFGLDVSLKFCKILSRLSLKVSLSKCGLNEDSHYQHYIHGHCIHPSTPSLRCIYQQS